MARPKKAAVKCIVPDCKNPGKLAKCCPNHYAKAKRLGIKCSYTKAGEATYSKEQITQLSTDQRKAGAVKRSKNQAKAAGSKKSKQATRSGGAAGAVTPDFDTLLAKLDEVITTFSEGFNRIQATLAGEGVPVVPTEPSESERLAAEPDAEPPEISTPSQVTPNGITNEQSKALEL